MKLGYRGSVNSWECDENDHLNVRFYVEKHWQTVCGALPGLLAAELTPGALARQLRSQHLRFLQESRLAAPLSGYADLVAATDAIKVLTELRHTFSGEVLSTCLHTLNLAAPSAGGQTLPAYAAPRGVADADLAYVDLPMAELESFGFHVIGRGVVQAQECADEVMAVHNYMGRISDSMPHLWGLLGANRGELDAGEGGAVLEYRLRYHAQLQAGDVYEIHSGLAAVGAKVQRFAHLLFDVSSGQLAASAEAAGVRMDLAARKALTLSSERQAEMAALLLKSFP